MLEGLARNHGVRRVMAELIAGTQGYRGLKWRLAQTREFALAWRALMPGNRTVSLPADTAVTAGQSGIPPD